MYDLRNACLKNISAFLTEATSLLITFMLQVTDFFDEFDTGFTCLNCNNSFFKISWLLFNGSINSTVLPLCVECRAEVIDHKVQWQKTFNFECKMVANAITAVLEPCKCRVSVRKVKNLQCLISTLKGVPYSVC